MDFSEWQRFCHGSWDRLSEWWFVKVLAGACLLPLQRHVALISLFAIVVALDLLAKWLALAYGYLREQCVRSWDLWSCFLSIPMAQRAGVIRSDAMRKHFCGKMAVYLILIIGGIIGDQMLIMVGEDAFFVSLCVSYLVVSEMISIVENLNDAGVDVMVGLIDLLRNRR